MKHHNRNCWRFSIELYPWDSNLALGEMLQIPAQYDSHGNVICWWYIPRKNVNKFWNKLSHTNDDNKQMHSKSCTPRGLLSARGRHVRLPRPSTLIGPCWAPEPEPDPQARQCPACGNFLGQAHPQWLTGSMFFGAKIKINNSGI